MKTRIIVFLCFLLAFFFLLSCSEKEKKEAKFVVVEQEFTYDSDDSENAGGLNVKGLLKNDSPYDAKRVVVTGSCAECSEVMSQGSWFSTKNPEFKAAKQSAVINYISAGNTEPFEFKGIAYWFKSAGKSIPQNNPEGLEVYVESFETVQD